eukprot:7272160-Alexandrium_andersonii.AAC.1
MVMTAATSPDHRSIGWWTLKSRPWPAWSMVNSAMAGQPVCSRSCRACIAVHASATCIRPSVAGGNALRTARPSSATLAAQAAVEAP